MDKLVKLLFFWGVILSLFLLTGCDEYWEEMYLPVAGYSYLGDGVDDECEVDDGYNECVYDVAEDAGTTYTSTITENISYITFFEDYYFPQDEEREIIRVNEPWPYRETVRISSNKNLYDFRIHWLGMHERLDEDTGTIFYLGGYFFHLPVLMTNQTLEYFAFLPCGSLMEAFAFTANGQQYVYPLSYNGRDGGAAVFRENRLLPRE